MESLVGAHSSTPPRDSKKAGYSALLEESPASLKELGSRAQTVRGGEPDYL